jgi:gliding motility-associated-like protein
MIVHPMPTVVFDPGEVIIYAGTSFKMSPVITGDITSYRWTPSAYLSDPTLVNPVATPGQNQYYTLDVSTAIGCKASSRFQIKVFRDVIMPNAFTPNGDGVNDIFRVPPIYQSVKLHYLIVYNRWGEKVFESKDVNKGWDGNLKGLPQPSGNYVWVVEYENPVTGQLQLAKGSVVLMR